MGFDLPTNIEDQVRSFLPEGGLNAPMDDQTGNVWVVGLDVISDKAVWSAEEYRHE